ncbi:alginate export family protein [Roseovarius sp. 2305UL8-3]|uniref:alginate export family protein n=1 Tax=Roseovarius conchicola TaxID=3121636 RepID=UPI0035288E11
MKMLVLKSSIDRAGPPQASPLQPDTCIDKKARFLSMNLICAAAAFLIFPFGGMAFADPDDPSEWIRFHFDKKPHVTKKVTDRLAIGVALKLTAERARHLDFESRETETETKLEGQLGLLYDTGGLVRSYLELNYATESLASNQSNARDAIFEVNEAYVSFRNSSGNQALSIGRWSVSDEREWLFEEELDGIHYFHRGHKFAVEMMYAREQIFHKDLLEDHDDNEPDHFYTRAYANLPGDKIGSLYGLYQRGQDRGDADLFWLGLSFAGHVSNDINYWAELAHVSGREKSRDIRGFGLDVGLTRTFSQWRSNPRVTAGLAFGSGDDGSGSDTAFRQTDIQGNSDKFGGRTNFKYYGEVFDPELSNLAIFTLGLGFDFLNKSSIDIVYHNSFQHRASTKIRNSNLDRKPNGISRHLGHEINLVVGVREFKNVDIDLIGGVFFPGSAFDDHDDPATYLGVEFSLEF